MILAGSSPTPPTNHPIGKTFRPSIRSRILHGSSRPGITSGPPQRASSDEFPRSSVRKASLRAAQTASSEFSTLRPGLRPSRRPPISAQKPASPKALDERGEDAGVVGTECRTGRSLGCPGSDRSQLGSLLKSLISGSSPGRSHLDRSTTIRYLESSTMNAGSVAFHTPLTGFCLNDRIFR